MQDEISRIIVELQKQRFFEDLTAKYWNNSSAVEIQEKMIADVNKFIGKAPQHDDMTMVILKIN